MWVINRSKYTSNEELATIGLMYNDGYWALHLQCIRKYADKHNDRRRL